MLEVRNLVSGYGALSVLRSVSLRVRESEVIGLIGANGAGKSTLVRTVCGLLRPFAGEVVMDGHDITGLAPHKLPRSRIAVVLENRNLFGELSVRDNLSLAHRMGKRVAAPEIQFDLDNIYELFPIIRERYYDTVGVLSGGQQQMVAIARALLLQPRLLIMDEPSTGLAPVVVKEILTVLRQLREQHGMSMLLVEQNVAIAAEMTDRCYVMSVGRIVHEIAGGEMKDALETGRLVKAYLGGKVG